MQNKYLIENTLALVCARGGSKGLKGKNFTLLNKKPLISFAICKILKNKLKYNCLSTDSKKIVKISEKYGLKSFFIRPKKFSTSNVPKLKVWQHALAKSEIHYKKKFKYILDVEVTNPLTNSNDLGKFLTKFNKIKNIYDGMFCVRESRKNPYFNILVKKKNGYKIFSSLNKKVAARQLAPKTYDHIAALYVFNASYIKKTKHFLDGKLIAYKLPLLKSIDIDDKEDLQLVKKILK